MSIAGRLKRWLPHLSVADQPPIALAQRRIFIVPTASGLLFAIVLFVMLLGAINYDLALGHALVFLLAAIGLVSMVHTWRNLRALRLTPGRAAPVFAGELARFTVQLESDDRRAHYALELSFAGQETAATNVAADGRASVAVPCLALRRGRLDPGRLTLTTRYPLGLFRAWCYPHPALSCLVYPRPTTTPLPPPLGTASDGLRHGEQRDGGDEDFTGLRLRRPNDSPRHIAWKAVARDIDQRPLLVKEFAGGAAQEHWLDWSLTPESAGLETRLSLLAGWVLDAAQNDLRYGLRLPGCERQPGQGNAHRNTCLEALALYGQP
jgi:uncharacterized protein (DUF58 family)